MALRNLDGRCERCGATVAEHLDGRAACGADMGPPDGQPTCGAPIPALADRKGNVPRCDGSPGHAPPHWIWGTTR
jgi:hypothetical protein